MGTNRTRVAGMAVGVALLAVSAAPVSGALARGVDVSICGAVEEYTPPTARAAGSVTVDGDTFDVAPGVRLPGAIRAGADRCLVFTFDDGGRIASVADASGAGGPDEERLPASPEGDENEQAPDVTGSGARAESAEDHENAVVTGAGSEVAETGDTIAAQSEDLPRTGGSAPTGGLFSLVSLAAAMLAGLGTFVLRRDA